MFAAIHGAGKKTHLPWLFPNSSSISSFPAMTPHKVKKKKRQKKTFAGLIGLVNKYAWTFLCSNLNSKIT